MMRKPGFYLRCLSLTALALLITPALTVLAWKADTWLLRMLKDTRADDYTITGVELRRVAIDGSMFRGKTLYLLTTTGKAAHRTRGEEPYPSGRDGCVDSILDIAVLSASGARLNARLRAADGSGALGSDHVTLSTGKGKAEDVFTDRSVERQREAVQRGWPDALATTQRCLLQLQGHSPLPARVRVTLAGGRVIESEAVNHTCHKSTIE